MMSLLDCEVIENAVGEFLSYNIYCNNKQTNEFPIQYVRKGQQRVIKQVRSNNV